MGAAASPLTPFEVSIAGRSTAFSRLKHVSIHGQAHAATGFAPLKARLFEQAVEPFLFRLFFHQARTGHHHGPYSRGDAPASGQAGCQAEVFDA